MLIKSLNTFVLFFSILMTFFVYAGPHDDAYIKNDITEARFFKSDLQKLLKKASELARNMNRDIVGQERVARAIQEKLVQYIENWGSIKDDPVAMHLIGLPGIGKTAMLRQIKQTGIEIVHLDSQRFADAQSINDLMYILRKVSKNSERKPVLLLFDEIDKVPEIVKGEKAEETRPLIGVLNQILTDGYVNMEGRKVELSNIMVATAMNLAPSDIEKFSSEVFDEAKSFYDFSLEDFAALDKWLNGKSSSRDKVLASLFRTNTVSRLSPNTIIVKPLTEDDHENIIKRTVEASLSEEIYEHRKAQRLETLFTDDYVDFLKSVVINASSGARQTVFLSTSLTRQLVGYGAKLKGTGSETLNIPRKILIDYDKNQKQVKLVVTPKVKIGNEWKEKESFETFVEYDRGSQIFITPENVTYDSPKLTPRKKTYKVTKAMIRNARFPKTDERLKTIAQSINETLIGQEELSRELEEQVISFHARPVENLERPHSIVLAGFPGIGKSELINLTGRYADLPIIKINMQEYASNGDDVVDKFVSDLHSQIQQKELTDPSKRFILLIEELDKVYEINPQNGAVVDRPVMGILKELLNSGRIEKTIRSNGYGTEQKNLDIRNALMTITMNFGVDRFGFEADPRLTSIQDVLSAWKQLNGSVADKKSVLGSLFLPETVSRIINQTYVVKPLDEIEYKTLINRQSDAVLNRMFMDPDTRMNISSIQVEMTSSYKNFLYNESVIPSEGARNTVVSVANILGEDIERGLQRISRDRALSAEPLVLKLDYSESSEHPMVSIKVRKSDELRGRWKTLESYQPVLKFPNPQAYGKLSEERIHTTIHEFGHALSAVRLGLRIRHISIVSPGASVGGYVTFQNTGDQSARAELASVHSLLASRAMEKIFFAPNPLSVDSGLYIDGGASSDIKQATSKLWSIMYELGFDPRGGVINRAVNAQIPWRFEDIPHDVLQKLALILQEMENQIIEDFIKAHPKQWYIEKIKELALAGIMDERQFYSLVDYEYPGSYPEHVSRTAVLHDVFADVIAPNDEKLSQAKGQKLGDTQTTAEENVDAAMENFKRAVNKHLGELQVSNSKDGCFEALREILTGK